MFSRGYMYGWNSLQVRAHHAQKPLRSISPHLWQTVMGYVDSDRSIKPAKRVNNSGGWCQGSKNLPVVCDADMDGCSSIQRSPRKRRGKRYGNNVRCLRSSARSPAVAWKRTSCYVGVETLVNIVLYDVIIIWAPT